MMYSCKYCRILTTNKNEICHNCAVKLDLIRRIREIVYEIKNNGSGGLSK